MLNLVDLFLFMFGWCILASSRQGNSLAACDPYWSLYRSLKHVCLLCSPLYCLTTWKCWHSQIHTWGVRTAHSLSLQSPDTVLMSCQRIQKCSEMRWLIFNLTEPNPMQDKSEGKLDVFLGGEVFEFNKISYSRAFSRVCVREHCIRGHVNVSPLIIWLSPASLDRGGDSTVCLCHLLAGP